MADVLVLCYHAVSERWPSDLAVTPDRLEEQLSLLARRGWRGARFREAVAAPPHSRTLAVTFDDAFRSVLDLALPVMSRLGLPGSVYAVSSFAESGEPLRWDGVEQWAGSEHAGELLGMGWDELGRLADEGWEVGSHTRTHPSLPSLGDDELREELGRSREECERGLGRPCDTIAYPYGDVDERVAEAARAAGYAAGGTLPSSVAGASALRFPRAGVYRGDAGWRFRLKVAGPVRALRRSGPWRALRG